MPRGPRGRGRGGRLSRELAGIKAELREQLREIPRLINRGNRLEPPSVRGVIQSMIWVRKTVTLGDASYIGNITEIAAGIDFGGANISFNIHRVRVMLWDVSGTQAGSPCLAVAFRNTPTDGAITTFQDYGVSGVSYAHVEADLSRSWKAASWQGGETATVFTVITATLGGEKPVNLVYDCLCNFEINLYPQEAGLRLFRGLPPPSRGLATKAATLWSGKAREDESQDAPGVSTIIPSTPGLDSVRKDSSAGEASGLDDFEALALG